MGLPKANRLRKNRDFQKVFKRGIRCSGRWLILRAWRDKSPQNGVEELPPPRIGVSVGKKVSKKAVERNRLKRQIKGALRELLAQIAPGWQLVLVVKPEASRCEYEQFLRELKKLLKKAEVINGHS